MDGTTYCIEAVEAGLISGQTSRLQFSRPSMAQQIDRQSVDMETFDVFDEALRWAFRAQHPTFSRLDEHLLHCFVSRAVWFDR